MVARFFLKFIIILSGSSAAKIAFGEPSFISLAAVGSKNTSQDKSISKKGKKSLAPPRKKSTPQSEVSEKKVDPAVNSAPPIKKQTIIDIQAGSVVSTLKLVNKDGVEGLATLIDLNPKIGSWYLLKLKFPEESNEYSFNLELVNPDIYKISLDEKFPQGLTLHRNNETQACELFENSKKTELLNSLKSTNAYVPFCKGQMYVRNKVDGRKTTKEWVAEFLRDNVWGGEEVTTFVKEKFFKDKFILRGEAEKAGKEIDQGSANGATAPLPGKISNGAKELVISAPGLGLSIAGHEGQSKMIPGQWYELKTQDGIYFSTLKPDMIEPGILESHKSSVTKLDSIEANALVYLVAFDLQQFRLGYLMGTDHPRVDWSPRVLDEVRDRAVPGPDGIGNWSPLVTTGMVNPSVAERVVATFTGGFKRDHGAMKWGTLAYKNRGTHYGFIENGVIFSRLNPGLATIYAEKDGQVRMRTWEEADRVREGSLLFARQNGVSLIEWDDTLKVGIPNKLVRQWGPGNWSGSEDSKLRTLRAGVCLQENAGKSFLIYGYFSTATPAAMARAFQAYECSFAMHMDMNALEHTYLAVYSRAGKQISVEHLITGMDVLDMQYKNRTLPRFLGFPDNRDFFYLYKHK